MNEPCRIHDELVVEVATLRRRIADLEATEKALREGEQRAELIVRLAPLGICECDVEGRITYVNPCEEAITGFPAAETIGRYVWENMEPGPARDALPGLIKKGVAEDIQPYPYESRHYSKRGVPYDVRINWSFKRDPQGKIVGFVCMITDITEQRRCQAALQTAHDELENSVKQRTADLVKANEQLAIFKKFAESSAQGFGIADLGGHIIYINPAMCRMMGGTAPGEFIGQHLAAYVADESDVPVMDEYLPILLRDGEWAKEGLLRTVQGTVTPVHNSSFLIRDDAGKPIYVAGIVTDISDRKRVEEALRKERSTLRHLLQSSDHERQLIAYDIHDGLAQQLAGAIMYFDAFRHLDGAGSNEAAKAFDTAMTMLRQGHFEARRLISGVRPPILDESGVVQAIAHLVHEESRENGPTIGLVHRVSFDRLTPTLENAIYRITQEALFNACQHSKSDQVQVELMQQGDLLHISVQDWGTGFDTSAAHSNRFGLAGIRERARLLGGTFTIQSSPGKGTQLQVDLPLVFEE